MILGATAINSSICFSEYFWKRIQYMHKAATGWNIRSPAGCSCTQGSRLTSKLRLMDMPNSFSHPPLTRRLSLTLCQFSLPRNQTDSFLTSSAPAKLACLVFSMIFTFIPFYLAFSLATYIKTLSNLNIQHKNHTTLMKTSLISHVELI